MSSSIILSSNELLYDLKVYNIHVDACDENGFSLLMSFSEKGNLNIVRMLIDNGSNLKSRNILGLTALAMACMHSHNLEIVKLLFRYDNNINDIDNLNTTILMAACWEKDNFNIVKYLVEECDADVNLLNLDKDSALSFACIKGEFETVKLLYPLTSDRIINLRNKDGYKPVNLAFLNKHLDIVNYILDQVETI